jgi:thiamine-phosphate pyrophosphorylase
MFATTTKVVGYAPQGLERLRHIRARVRIPIVAIGGITEETASAVRAAGADAIAMIGEIGKAPDIEQKVRRLVAVLC